MIKKSTPLTLVEVSELLGKGEKQDAMKKFIKQFSNISVKDAQKLKEELKALDLIKLKEDYIVKIIDFMPQDAADLIKATSGVSFDQDEITKILEIVKKY